MLIVVLLLTGCATNPVSGKRTTNFQSEAWEVRTGAENFGKYRQIQYGDYTLDPELSRYVSDVGRKLAKFAARPHLPYEFVILNMDEVNAWALPGGKIAINRGLLLKMRNEAELAAVLAHEIVHADAAHSAARQSQSGLLQAGVIAAILIAGEDHQQAVAQVGGLTAGLISMNYSREDEREADFYSMNYMVKAGYNPEGAVSLQQTFVDLHGGGGGGLLATHPSSSERVRLNRARLAELPAGGYLGESEYRIKTRGLRKNEEAYRLFAEGRNALGEKKAKDALQYARAARELEPREAHFYALEGKALLALGKESTAKRSFDEAIQRNPDFFEFHLLRGLLYKNQGRKQQAIDDLKRSWTLLPTEKARDALLALGVR